MDPAETRPTPLCVPEDLVRYLRLPELVDGRREQGRRAGPITARIGARTWRGECHVGPPGSAVLLGTMTLRQLDLEPDPVTKGLRPGPGIRI